MLLRIFIFFLLFYLFYRIYFSGRRTRHRPTRSAATAARRRRWCSIPSAGAIFRKARRCCAAINIFAASAALRSISSAGLPENPTIARMVLEGKIEIRAPAREVWAFLIDIDRFASCMPGLERATQIDERTFDGVVGATVGRSPENSIFARRSSTARRRRR
jgi:hypothetical protein